MSRSRKMVDMVLVKETTNFHDHIVDENAENQFAVASPMYSTEDDYTNEILLAANEPLLFLENVDSK